MDAPPDSISSLQNDDVAAGVLQSPSSREPGKAGSDDNDIGARHSISMDRPRQKGRPQTTNPPAA